MELKEIKKLFKYFVLLFCLSFVLTNWDIYGWVFNYRAVTGFFQDFFSKNKAAAVIDNSGMATSVAEAIVFENTINIPKIDISAPVVFFEDENEMDTILHDSLDKGVIHYPKSVLPGEAGQTILLGHSAPPGWPKIKYDWVFSKINQLAAGDKIILDFEGENYVYNVTQYFILNKGKEPPYNLASAENILLLISCWPPGKNQQRIFVEAVLE